MPRFKDYNYQQTVMLPVSFEQQILPGTFEHSINYLVDQKLDLSIFNQRYKNDDGGRPAYDPSILLKIVLLAYSRGITSSRKIEALCRENVVFMAISADSRPHFTTVADFISTCPDEIAQLFQQVILICDDLGLIGKEMFAVDGCKMPSNASKEWSGTRAELKKKAAKIDRAVRYMLKKHRDEDKKGHAEESIRRREEKQIEKLLAASDKIESFLENNQERQGRTGKEVKSNVTDNDSAKMKTGHVRVKGTLFNCSTEYSSIKQINNVPHSLERMKQKIDSEFGRHIYSQRLGMVEPVFGNIRETLGLDRFTLRGKKKVDGQWKLMTMLHNLFKIHRYGWAG